MQMVKILKFIAIFLLVSTASIADPQVPVDRSVDRSVIMDEAKLAKARPRDTLTLANRNQYGKIVHIYGDSVARGYGYRAYDFPDEFNNFVNVARAYIADQGIKESDLYIRYAWSQSNVQMAEEVANGIIRPGDIVLIEDAGPHQHEEHPYEPFKGIIEIFKGKDVTVVFTTMFDFNPGLSNSNYDLPIGDLGLSVNRALFQIAKECCSILDWNTEMDSLYADIGTRFGVYPMQVDGVHPNVVGNLLLARLLIEFLGIPTPNKKGAEKRFADALAYYCDKVSVWECSHVRKNLPALDIFREVEKSADVDTQIGAEYKPRMSDCWIKVKAFVLGTLRSFAA